MTNINSDAHLKAAEEAGSSQETSSSHRHHRFYSLLIGIASVFLFSFVAVRAVSVPFTHDESFSYLNFVEPNSFEDIVLNPADNSGNHLLNTYAMKAVTLFMHPDDWTLRLPSLFAYAIFLYAGYQICRQLFSPVYQVVVFILLNLNMFVLQFFSLARGYALALGLMMASLWLFLRSQDKNANRPLLQAAAIGIAALSCIANLSFLNYYCALLLVLFVIRIRNQIRSGYDSKLIKYYFSCIGAYWDMALVSGFLFLALSQFIIKLREAGQFYYGGNKGFIEDSLVTLLQACLYDSPIQGKILAEADRWIMVVAALLFIFYAVITIFVKKDDRVSKALSLYWIMFILAISFILQHYLLESRYPYDRAVIMFVPLFVLSAAWFLCWEGKRLRILMQAKTAIFLFGALYCVIWHFGQVATIHSAIPWKFDSESPEVLNCLEVLKTTNPKQEVLRLGITGFLQPTLMFYKKIRQLDWIADMSRDGIKGGNFDYYYITGEDLDYAKSVKAEILKYYSQSSAWLMRSANPEQ